MEKAYRPQSYIWSYFGRKKKEKEDVVKMSFGAGGRH